MENYVVSGQLGIDEKEAFEAIISITGEDESQAKGVGFFNRLLKLCSIIKATISINYKNETFSVEFKSEQENSPEEHFKEDVVEEDFNDDVLEKQEEDDWD